MFMVCVSFATVQFSPSCSPHFLSPWFLKASLIKLIGPPFGKCGPHFSAALMGPALSLSGNPFFFWHCSLGSPVSLGCSSSPPEAGVSWPGCPVSLGVLLVPVAFLWPTWSFWMKAGHWEPQVEGESGDTDSLVESWFLILSKNHTIVFL